jgi:hypothetical protein
MKTPNLEPTAGSRRIMRCAVVCGIVFVISLLWVREVPLRRGLEEAPVGDEPSPQPAARLEPSRSRMKA